MGITEDIKTIQTEAERELGFSIAPQFWEAIEEDVGNAPADYDGDPDGLEGYIRDYQGVTGRHIRAVQILLPSIKGDLHSVKKGPSTGENKDLTEPKTMSRLTLDRHAYLVKFILSKKEGGIRSRCKWKQLTTEWNKEHPYHQKTQDNLRVEYTRALHNDRVLMLVTLPIIKAFGAQLIDSQHQFSLMIKASLAKAIDSRRQHPLTKASFDHVTAFWHQHPEAKDLNELVEIEEREAMRGNQPSNRPSHLV